MSVEVVLLPGKGGVPLTGQLGEVMRESAQAAVSYARARAKELGLDDKFHETLDVHIHIPAGAVPKDGPSAGITMATALISALTRQPARRDVAMTGEITLRGRVLPIGGLKEKVLAAHRAGLKIFMAPEEERQGLAGDSSRRAARSAHCLCRPYGRGVADCPERPCCAQGGKRVVFTTTEWPCLSLYWSYMKGAPCPVMRTTVQLGNPAFEMLR